MVEMNFIILFSSLKKYRHPYIHETQDTSTHTQKIQENFILS